MNYTESEAKADRLQAMRWWFSTLEEHVKVLRGRFAPDDPEDDIRRLSQKRVRRLMRNAATLFWGGDAATRSSLKPRYWRAPSALKLVADDVFVETLEVARRQAASGTTIKKSVVLSEPDVRSWYRSTIEEFIRGNPFLITDPALRKSPLYPVRSQATERAGSGLLLAFLIRLFPADRLGIGPQYLVSVAAEKARKIESDLASVTGTTAQDFALDPDAGHLIGSYFMLLQLFLSDLHEIGGPPRFDADYWYKAAADAVTELRTRVLGLHAALERKAIHAGNAGLAAELRASGRAAIDPLVRLYSVRVEETAAAWAFRTRRVPKKEEPFLQQRLLVGANGVRETLMSYLGRGNPDGDAPEAMDVAHLVGHQAEFSGKKVKVLGEFRSKLQALRSLDTADQVFLVGSGEDFVAAGMTPAAVEVEGTLDTSGGAPVLVVDRIDRFAQSYLASVGFLTPLEGDPPRLDLTPSWRRPTTALQQDAEQESRYDSIPQGVDGQQLLLLDLLAVPDVAKAIRKKLGKKAAKITPLGLHDHELRGAIWHALFARFHREDPDTALDRLLAHLQRFFSHFTRHTLWNVRDEGKPYFDTNWPQTISGRTLLDCGVYDVLAALDLYRAISGVEGQRMRFGFLTILNHISLVGYSGNRSFFVNNDLIRGPVEMPDGADKDDAARADFALRWWGPVVFSDVYNVRYIVALVRVPHKSVSSKLGESAFKKKLWKRYLRLSNWWGLQPGIASEYHRRIIEYDRGMRGVATLLEKTPATAEPSSKAMLDVSQETKQLFDLAEKLAAPKNFGERQEFKATEKASSAIGVHHPDAEPPPIYEVVRRLAQAKKAGQTLTSEQEALAGKPATVEEHANALAVGH